MGSSEDESIDLSWLMPDLWPDIEDAIDAGSGDAFFRDEDPLFAWSESDVLQPGLPIEEQDTLVRLPGGSSWAERAADRMPVAVQATPSTLILPAVYWRQRLARAMLWLAYIVLIALIALFLVADTWLLFAHFLSPR